MLRITKKERDRINYLNSRIRRKMNKLKTTFNIRAPFDIITPSKFTSRAELNMYKEQARIYLAPYTHKYIKGGLTINNYFFPIPYKEYQEIKRELVKHHNYARRMQQKANKITLKVRGKKQVETLGDVIERNKSLKHPLGSRRLLFHDITFSREKINSKRALKKFKYALHKYNQKDYYRAKLSQTQENFISALYNTFGRVAEPIVEIIKTLSPDEFALLFESETLVDFYYLYSEEYATVYLQSIANSILHFLAENESYLEDKYTKSQFVKLTDDLKDIQNINSVNILSEYKTHSYIVTLSDGRKYKIHFRTDDLNEFEYLLKQNVSLTDEQIKNMIFTSKGALKSNVERL